MNRCLKFVARFPYAAEFRVFHAAPLADRMHVEKLFFAFNSVRMRMYVHTVCMIVSKIRTHAVHG